MVVVEDESPCLEHGEGVLRHLHAAQFRCVQDMDRVTDEELLMLAQMPIVLLSLQRVEQSCGDPVGIRLRNA